jgi:hypothetical protein
MPPPTAREAGAAATTNSLCRLALPRGTGVSRKRKAPHQEASAAHLRSPLPANLALGRDSSQQTSTGDALAGENEQRLRWLIERIDSTRVATEARATSALSIAALLLAGIAFALDKAAFGSPGHSLSRATKVLLLPSIAGSLVLLVLSVVSAAAAIVNVRTTSRRLVGNKIPSRTFLHTWDTIYVYPEYEQFSAGLRNASGAQIAENMSAYLWAAHHLYQKRYLALRRAIRLLLLSLLFFSVAIAILLAESMTR